MALWFFTRSLICCERSRVPENRLAARMGLTSTAHRCSVWHSGLQGAVSGDSPPGVLKTGELAQGGLLHGSGCTGARAKLEAELLTPVSIEGVSCVQ